MFESEALKSVVDTMCFQVQVHSHVKVIIYVLPLSCGSLTALIFEVFGCRDECLLSKMEVDGTSLAVLKAPFEKFKSNVSFQKS